MSVRDQILSALSRGRKMTLRDLNEKLDTTASNVSIHLRNLAEEKLIKKVGKAEDQRNAVLWQKRGAPKPKGKNGEARVARAAKRQVKGFVDVPLPKKRSKAKKRIKVNGEVHASLSELEVTEHQIAELEGHRMQLLERIAGALRAEL